MSSAATLARPYAKAAFEIAQKAGALSAFSGHLAESAAIAANPQVAALIASPRLQTAARVALLLPNKLATDSGFAHLLATMAENQRLSLLPEVAVEFEQLRADAERTLHVKVRSAQAIDATQQQQLIDKLSERFNRAVTLAIEIVPDLIGGAVVDTGQVVIDGSLVGKLQRLHTELAA